MRKQVISLISNLNANTWNLFHNYLISYRLFRVPYQGDSFQECDWLLLYIFKLQLELLGLVMSVCMSVCLQTKFDTNLWNLGLSNRVIGEGEGMIKIYTKGEGWGGEKKMWVWLVDYKEYFKMLYNSMQYNNWTIIICCIFANFKKILALRWVLM